MRLTVGMAHYEDLSGVYFTIQSLRLNEPDIMDRVEFLVVDNYPFGPHGKSVKEFLTWVPNARYIAAPEVAGTAAPRDRVFREATGDAVLCLDCHVLLQPGSLRRLLAYYEANPDTRDLLSGPMLYDNHREMSTHFKDQWRGEMWGTWDTDPRGLDVEGQPFEIGAMGLGLFSCRKDAWLGFNPEFRGFGGEEWYIHEKFRKAGAKCLCLPFLRWNHRFGRPDGVKYPLTRWHKVRNYVIGHRELGRDLSPVYDHFVRTGLVSQGEWDQILAGAVEPGPQKQSVQKPAEEPAKSSCGGCGTKIPDNLETWFRQARDTPSDINEHAERLRELAAGCDHVVEFGHRRGVSSVAILAGQPKRFTSYDLHTTAEVSGLKNLMGGTQFSFVQGDSLHVEVEPHDFLFIDTVHTADRVYAELTRHAPKCRRWIALHDTVIYGESGENGGPGLLPGLRRWLRENPDWSVVEHRRNNNGFTVLSRNPDDKPKLPAMLTQAWNYAKALTRHTLSGSKLLPEAEVQKRLNVCLTCDQRNGNRCSVCGCYLDTGPDGKEGKALWADQSCPLGKWPLPVVEGKP